MDLNRDGKIDLAFGTEHGVAVFLGDGRGGFQPAAGSPFRTGRGTWRIEVIDVNHDGKPDFIRKSYVNGFTLDDSVCGLHTACWAMHPGKEPVILLVEDEEDDVFLLRKALKAAGVQNRLFLARHGQEALDYLTASGEFFNREQFPCPALMFLDLKLPYRNGLEILAWLHEQPELSSLTTVILSSSNQSRDLEAAHQLGATKYLIKPPTQQMICDLVNALNLDGIRCQTPP